MVVLGKEGMHVMLMIMAQVVGVAGMVEEDVPIQELLQEGLVI